MKVRTGKCARVEEQYIENEVPAEANPEIKR